VSKKIYYDLKETNNDAQAENQKNFLRPEFRTRRLRGRRIAKKKVQFSSTLPPIHRPKYAPLAAKNPERIPGSE
jgi:hypothetical protein